MNWISKLERKFGKYAIPNLMNYIIILYIFGFVLDTFAYGFYEQYLALDAYAILHGQVWRIFTFIIQPPSTNLIFVVFTMYLYYMIGRTLEYVWGTFRFNLYYFMGVAFHILAAMTPTLLTATTHSSSAPYAPSCSHYPPRPSCIPDMATPRPSATRHNTTPTCRPRGKGRSAQTLGKQRCCHQK